MGFLQSKVGKLFLGAFITTVLLTIGAMKMGGSVESEDVPKPPQEEQAVKETPVADNKETTEQTEQDPTEQKANTEITVSNSEAFKNAKKAQEEGNTINAIKYYTVASNSSDVNTKNLSLKALGNIYMQANNTKMIVETYEKLLETEKDPDERKDIYGKLAETYKYMNASDKAIEMYKESYKIEKTPNDVLRLCELYESMYDYDNVANIIRDYLKVYPHQESIFSKFSRYTETAPMHDTPVQREGDPNNPNEAQENNQE